MPVGEAAVRAVTVANPEPYAVEVREVSTIAGRPFGLAEDTCSGTTLPAGGSCSVVVRFSPVAPGVAETVVKLALRHVCTDRTYFPCTFDPDADIQTGVPDFSAVSLPGGGLAIEWETELRAVPGIVLFRGTGGG
ncbi:hypothetical protein [Pseudonocardia pini]|uniref:hypothetical protein n=1 Tax=Pseudonocardia pini TaxID=2758030 RepID=UPI0015F067F8|nr:hypothetical protein [Pseudonocardia pini]